MIWTVVIAFVLCSCSVHGWLDNDFNGISQVALVVDNLEEATTFYTSIGGMLVSKLSTSKTFLFWISDHVKQTSKFIQTLGHELQALKVLLQNRTVDVTAQGVKPSNIALQASEILECFLACNPRVYSHHFWF